MPCNVSCGHSFIQCKITWWSWMLHSDFRLTAVTYEPFQLGTWVDHEYSSQSNITSQFTRGRQLWCLTGDRRTCTSDMVQNKVHSSSLVLWARYYKPPMKTCSSVGYMPSDHSYRLSVVAVTLLLVAQKPSLITSWSERHWLLVPLRNALWRSARTYNRQAI